MIRLQPLPFALALATLGSLAACDGVRPMAGSDADHERRITAIESEILPLIRIEGREHRPWTIEERMAELGVPAASAAVVVDGEVVWARAWGLADVEEGRPATPETLFQSASNSKPVAAYGALLLVEDGVLDLDGPVNAYLRSWQLPRHDWDDTHPVTVRHLLTHTGGLTVHGFPGYGAEEELPTVVQILDGETPANTAPVRVDQEPGSAWRYSGGGTTILQLAMADVTGEPFAAWMERSVLAPLGMTSSTYEQPLPDSLRERAATAYGGDMEAIPGNWHTYPEQAAAGLWTTPTDLVRWVIAVQRAASGERASSGGESGGERLLRAETAEAMLTPGLGGWGLGPVVTGEGAALRFLHGGSNAGFRSNMMGWLEGDHGMAVMTNSDSGGTLVAELMQAIATEYGWEGLEPMTITPVAIDPDRLADFVGRFAIPDTPMTFGVELDQEALWLTFPGSDPVELVPTGEDMFVEARSGQTATFDRDDDGAVRALHIGGGVFRKVDG